MQQRWHIIIGKFGLTEGILCTVIVYCLPGIHFSFSNRIQILVSNASYEEKSALREALRLDLN